ncbi:MAG: superoxide dismutase family protein [Clostridia bacterium]|nr:superoxide dismutase family protein [Clostridia bacterium]
MDRYQSEAQYHKLLSRRPAAWARIMGSKDFPAIHGIARFYGTPYGVLVSIYVRGLPSAEGPCRSPIFALHIHEGCSCTGNETDPFADAGSHYNPEGCPHPYHAGDLPPLFGAGGTAYSVCLTDRFTVEEVLGRTVILHRSIDDFSTQPAGNAGEKIACGTIMPNR